MEVIYPANWILDRLSSGRTVFNVRINDGEMQQMFRAVPQGKELGTCENRAWANYDLGDALLRMLEEFGYEDTDLEPILLGCSWNTDRADELGRTKFAHLVQANDLETANWCHEHWALESIGDGSLMRLLDWLVVTQKTVLVTNEKLCEVGTRLKCPVILTPAENSWYARNKVYVTARYFSEEGYTFIWCAGAGLKPTAWRLFKEFPSTSHLDLGHLFNGIIGLRDYGWLQRRDGWWGVYFDRFAPWYLKRS